LVLSRLEWSALAAILAFTVWTASSTVWSTNVTQSVLEAERTLVYVCVLLALFVIGGRRNVSLLLGGALGGITLVATYALATRFFPERFGFESLAGSRLAKPLGYWNALGLFAAMGC